MKQIKDGYKETEIGVLPEGWEVKSVGEFTEIIMGQSPSGESYNNEGLGIPLLNGPTEFGRTYPSAVQWTTSPTRICSDGDILFCVRGSSIGKMNISNDKYCIGRGLAAIREKKLISVKDFIYYTLQRNICKLLNASAGSTFPNINKEGIGEFKVGFPPISEQHRIAVILSTVDAHLEKLDAIIVDTQHLRKGMIQSLLTRGIGHTEFKVTEIGEIPKEWEVKELNECFVFYGGHSIPRSQFSEEGSYCLHYGDIHTRKASYISTLEDSLWLPKVQLRNEKIGTNLETGDLVFADASEDYDGVGKSIVVFNENSKIIAGLHTIVGKEKEERFNNHFKRYFLNTFVVRQQFKKFATGSKIYGISKGNLGKIKFCLPPIHEQHRIAEILSSIDDRIQLYEKEKEDTILLKKGLMEQLLTGKIRISTSI